MEIFFDENGVNYEKPNDVIPDWRVSGYPLIFKNETLLMVKPTWNDQWELPGGGIEIGELIKDGIVRECYEETGYRIDVEKQPLYVGQRNFFNKSVGKYYYSVILVYRGKLIDDYQNKEMINSVFKNEIAETGWAEYKKLKEAEVHPIVWPVISGLL